MPAKKPETKPTLPAENIEKKAERKPEKPKYRVLTRRNYSIGGNNVAVEEMETNTPFKFFIRVSGKDGTLKKTFGCYNLEHAKQILERLQQKRLE